MLFLLCPIADEILTEKGWPSKWIRTNRKSGAQEDGLKDMESRRHILKGKDENESFLYALSKLGLGSLGMGTYDEWTPNPCCLLTGLNSWSHSQGTVSWNMHRPFISNRCLLIPFHHLLTTCQNEDKTESLSNPTKASITLQFSLLQDTEVELLLPVFWFLPDCTPRR